MRGSLDYCKAEVARKLKRHRKDFLGITQTQAGLLLGVSENTINNYEKNRFQIPAYKYEHFIGLAPADLPKDFYQKKTEASHG